MGKQTFISLLMSCLLVVCFSCTRHNITGDLLAGNGNVEVFTGNDTLNIPVKNGHFAFTLLPENTSCGYATIIINGEELASPLFIENTDFHIVQNADSTFSIEEGGEWQRQEREYATLLQKWTQKGEEFRIDMRRAGEERDIAGIMHCRAELQLLDEEWQKTEKQFIASYPNSPVCLYHAYINRTQGTYEDLQAKIELFTPEALATELGQKLSAFYEMKGQLEVGSIVPDFKLKTPEGKEISLYSTQAKVKILDFWASWCGPCRAESPYLKKVYTDFKDKGLEIIGISLDNKRDAWTKAIEEDQLPWAQVSSLLGRACPVAKLYRVNGIPDIFILDADNRIIAKKARGENIYRIVSAQLK